MKPVPFKSGRYVKQLGYESFFPNRVNLPYHFSNREIDSVLEAASHSLGALNAYSALVPDVDFFVRMHVYKEATLSSRIEGTRTEIDEAFLPESQIDPERRQDWLEVQNYTHAMNYAIKSLIRLPLSMRLLKETHKILLKGVRGESKQPGEIRRSQNWIGGSNLSEAVFIPPPVADLPDLLSDLEKYWHNEKLSIPHLIKSAISHYQFETIHPFLDGNGRIGRLLITLYLVDKKMLQKPTLYLSDYFERNKTAYYDYLTLVRTHHDLDRWIIYFLQGILETSRKGIATFEKIIALRYRLEQKILSLGRKVQNSQRLLNLLYSQPIINVSELSKNLSISFPTANDLIRDFIELGILVETTDYDRNRLFKFEEYLKLFSD